MLHCAIKLHFRVKLSARLLLSLNPMSRLIVELDAMGHSKCAQQKYHKPSSSDLIPVVAIAIAVLYRRRPFYGPCILLVMTPISHPRMPKGDNKRSLAARIISSSTHRIFLSLSRQEVKLKPQLISHKTQFKFTTTTKKNAREKKEREITTKRCS